MVKFLIGFGKCPKHLLFILGNVIWKILNFFIFDAQINLKNQGGLFEFIPVLSNHLYIQNLLKKINGVVSKILLKTPNINLNEVEIRMLDVLEYINSESDCLKALVKNRPSELKKYLDKKKDSSAAVSVA